MIRWVGIALLFAQITSLQPSADRRSDMTSYAANPLSETHNRKWTWITAFFFSQNALQHIPLSFIHRHSIDILPGLLISCLHPMCHILSLLTHSHVPSKHPWHIQWEQFGFPYLEFTLISQLRKFRTEPCEFWTPFRSPSSSGQKRFKVIRPSI